MTTPFWYRMVVAPAPATAVPSMLPATYVPLKSASDFRLNTSALALACTTPMARRERPSTSTA